MKHEKKRDVEFLFEIGCLRFINRSWIRFLHPDVANNAEHMFRVLWIAWMLAEHEGPVNIEKVLKMALIHDITESRTGDVDYLSRQYTKRDDSKAIEHITDGTIFEKEVRAV
ncbi:MAG: HD domain-containing protein [Patescibacteria group bacterium]|jgi:putative hydrolase of HD superfamily